MVRVFRVMCLVVCAMAVPLAASAGWIVEWQNTASKKDKTVVNTEVATTYMSAGKVRAEQPKMATLIDYGSSRFTIMNSESQLYWSGKVDEYLQEMVKNRVEGMSKRSGRHAGGYGMPAVDEKSLPRIVIKRTEETQKIADHDTVKYTVDSNGERFQELWVAEGLSLSKDVDPAKALAFEEKMSAAKLGKTAAPLNALQRSDDYRKLLAKGFVLRSILYHPGGSFERLARSIRQADIEAAQFTVPETYRRVRLADVFPAPVEPTPGQGK